MQALGIADTAGAAPDARLVSRPLRLLIHDNSGHPFQIQLSRELARRGHVVCHSYFASMQSPKGAVAPRADDPPSLTIHPIRTDREFAKYSYIRRRFQDREVGRKIVKQARLVGAELVITANLPIDAEYEVGRGCARLGIASIIWLQDIYSVAIRKLLGGRFLGLGRLVAAFYERREAQAWRNGREIVCITEDFLPVLRRRGVPADRGVVIENWAPLDEITPAPRDNAWARENGLVGKRTVLYSGNLGLKHNPGLLSSLAAALRDDPAAVVVVISEGVAVDWLKAEKERANLENLRILPYQPYEQLSEVLSSADVLTAFIEPDAGVFSVPSKVLSYLCAGKPMVVAVPPQNLSARIVAKAAAGLLVEPSDASGFATAVRGLLQNPVQRAEMALNARAFAERSFDISTIADRFEDLAISATRRAGSARSPVGATDAPARPKTAA